MYVDIAESYLLQLNDCYDDINLYYFKPQSWRCALVDL